MTDACRCGCGRKGRGPERLADTCRRRWRNAGFPDVVPPAAHRGNDRQKAARKEDYAELRGQRDTREMAATRLKVCERTLYRYEAEFKREACLREQSAAAA